MDFDKKKYYSFCTPLSAKPNPLYLGALYMGLKLFNTLMIAFCLSFLQGCGSSDTDGANGVNNAEEITVAYVDNRINTKLSPPGSFTASGTVLVHDDGYQDNDLDIGRVILSKINSNTTGETLAVAFSYKHSTISAAETFAAFYIDSDNNPLTGERIADIGADVLIINQHAFDNSGSSISYADSHSWSGTQWIPQGGGYSYASTYRGFNIINTILVTNSTIVSGLLGMQEVKGVFSARIFPGGDPNAVTETIDITDSFSFAVPG